MPKYHPIEVGVSLSASRSDLVGFQWINNVITASFVLPDDDAHLLQVVFDRPCIVRLLDEMPLSTEDEIEPNEGNISEHIAYNVYDSAFSRAQSESWKLMFQPASHYRFITGWTCMDVLSQAKPSFAVILRNAIKSLA